MVSLTRIISIFAISLLLSILAIYRTDLFSLDRIRAPLLSYCDAQSEPFEWPQTFRYLGRGRQMYVFESRDGQYVLKFFDREKLKIHWYSNLPFAAAKRKMSRSEDKIRVYPQSYRLAYEWMRKETGLVLLHMGSSFEKHPLVQLIGKASRSYLIDLNTVPFILQRKGTDRLVDEKIAISCSALHSMIDQFLAIHEKRIQHGIADLDTDIKNNYAWLGDRLIYIDPARFFYDEELFTTKRLYSEWNQVTLPLRCWLQRWAPSELTLFEKKIKLCIDRCQNKNLQIGEGA